jgi:hypothetical protein
MIKGKRRDMGLGGTSWLSLAEAREMARFYRKIAREGGDPIEARAGRKSASKIISGLSPLIA